MRRPSDLEDDPAAELIAQEPLPDRAGGRLLVLDRASSGVRHARFPDFVDLVAPEDVLVLNVSRVIPARLHGKREMGKIAELLLVRELPDGSWIAMGHPGGKLKPGRRVTFGDDSAAEIVGRMGGGLRRVRFVGALDARATLAKYGEVPLPPYIRRPPRPEDRERYQTVYAAHDGSVAAPTAGLHFTSELLARIRAKGVAVTELDLHVGPGTFKPVQESDIANQDRKSTRLNSSHSQISYAVFCLKKKQQYEASPVSWAGRTGRRRRGRLACPNPATSQRRVPCTGSAAVLHLLAGVPGTILLRYLT